MARGCCTVQLRGGVPPAHKGDAEKWTGWGVCDVWEKEAKGDSKMYLIPEYKPSDTCSLTIFMQLLQKECQVEKNNYNGIFF